MKRLLPLALVSVVFYAVGATAQGSRLEQQLFTEIAPIKVFDNHSHLKFSEDDTGYDALPCDELPSDGAPPMLIRADQPDFATGAKAVFGLSSSGQQALQDSVAAKAKQRARLGDKYEDWVFDRTDIDILVANRVAMPTGRAISSRIRWVPYDDALLFPLNNASLKNFTADRNVLIGYEEQHLHEYLAALKLTAIPATLDEYLAKVVLPTLELQRKAGAIAIKFEAAYLRSLDFSRVSHADADRIFAAAAHATLGDEDYKRLQDFLFREIAIHAGKLGLPLHIHTGFGCGDWFASRTADPLLLETMITDPALKDTRFVLLHSVSVYTSTVQMLIHPNVYADLSLAGLLFSNQHYAEALRQMLEAYPEKLLYGSDAGPTGKNVEFEASAWVSDQHAKRALARALAAMMRDGEITHERAIQVAHMVLHDNAVRLYEHP